MIKIALICPTCQRERIYKQGKVRSGLQRYRCSAIANIAFKKTIFTKQT